MNAIGPSIWQACLRQGGSHALLAGAAALLLLGCGKAGPELVTVSGNVTLDGAPLTGASIHFVSTTGSVASTQLDSSGGFRLISQYGNGIPAGDYQVYILPTVQFDPHDPKRMMMPTTTPRAISPIPPSYQNPRTSGFTARVVGAKVSLRFKATVAIAKSS